MKIEFNNLYTHFLKVYQAKDKINKIGIWGSLPDYYDSNKKSKIFPDNHRDH